MSFIATAAVIGAGASYLGAREQSDAARDAANTSANTQMKMFNQSRADMEPWRQAGQGALFQMSDLMGIDTYDKVTKPNPKYIPSRTKGGGFFGSTLAGNLLGFGKKNIPAVGEPTITENVLRPRSDKFGSFMDYFGAEDFQKDPGYDFRLQEGQRALERSAAARGNLFSGATGTALTRYGQDYGSNEFKNAYNRWNTDRDKLFNRLSGIAGTGQTSAQEIGQWGMNTGQNVGNAYATGIQNAGAARASGYTGVANAANAGLNAWAQYRGMNQPPAPVQYNNGQPYYNSAGW